jgi:hypothetical protein
MLNWERNSFTRVQLPKFTDQKCNVISAQYPQKMYNPAVSNHYLRITKNCVENYTLEYTINTIS